MYAKSAARDSRVRFYPTPSGETSGADATSRTYGCTLRRSLIVGAGADLLAVTVRVLDAAVSHIELTINFGPGQYLALHLFLNLWLPLKLKGARG